MITPITFTSTYFCIMMHLNFYLCWSDSSKVLIKLLFYTFIIRSTTARLYYSELWMIKSVVWINSGLGHPPRLADFPETCPQRLQVWTFGCSVSVLCGCKTVSCFKTDSEPKSSSMSSLGVGFRSCGTNFHQHICIYLLHRQPSFMRRPCILLCVPLKPHQPSIRLVHQR